ncbi:MAG: BlaI/MecI/CopY family transcriptional regulator [Fimbriimonas sp.]
MKRPDPTPPALSRRERQIMDVLYMLGEGGVAEVREKLEDPPTYSTVRALLRILEEKGHIVHHEAEGRYVYRPRQETPQAGRSALSNVLKTFFGGRVEDAVAALISTRDADMTNEELERLEEMIRRAKEERR